MSDNLVRPTRFELVRQLRQTLLRGPPLPLGHKRMVCHTGIAPVTSEYDFLTCYYYTNDRKITTFRTQELNSDLLGESQKY
jgi:hypothetical protein